MTSKRAWVIGRALDCDVVVPHPSVSGRHCQLVWTEQGWFVKDLGSRNGTFVRGQRLVPEQMLAVQQGEEVLLAGSVPLPWSEVSFSSPIAAAPDLGPMSSGGFGARPEVAPSSRPNPPSANPSRPSGTTNWRAMAGGILSVNLDRGLERGGGKTSNRELLVERCAEGLCTTRLTRMPGHGS